MIANLFKTISGKSQLLVSPSKIIKTDNSFYDLSAKLISGETFYFSSLKGKKVLLVNTASKCGFTPQLSELENLYKENREHLVILGFPCNDFLFQEPKSNEEILEFCSINFGVSFLLFEKISLKKNNCSPIYEWLTNPQKNGWNIQKPTWNFCKYLVNEKGELVLFANSQIKPHDQRLLKAIQT